MRRGVLLASALLLAAATPVLAQNIDPKLESEHTVKPGETLSGVASRAEVPRILIIEANGLKSPYRLRAGQKLVIPRRRSHVVEAGDTGFGIALEYGVPWSAIAQANAIDPKARLRSGQELVIPTISRLPDAPSPSASPSPAPEAAAPPRFEWPLQGSVRRGFTARPRRGYHDGLDITARAGTAVRASAAGRVVYAAEEPRQFGNLVVIDHGDGWSTSYAFLSRITVKEGERVRKGERVGMVGHTGLARGDELHFELRRDLRALDPARSLPSREDD